MLHTVRLLHWTRAAPRYVGRRRNCCSDSAIVLGTLSCAARCCCHAHKSRLMSSWTAKFVANLGRAEITRQHSNGVARYWYSNSVCLSVSLSVRLTCSGILSKRLNTSSHYLQPYDSPVILVLLVLNVFVKFRRCHPLPGVEYSWCGIKILRFYVKSPCSGRRGHVANEDANAWRPPPRVSQMFLPVRHSAVKFTLASGHSGRRAGCQATYHTVNSSQLFSMTSWPRINDYSLV